MSFEIRNGWTVGTNTLHASALAQIDSTTKGFLGLPRMTAAQKNAISSPATGLMIYQTDGSIGVYHYNGTAWVSSGSDTLQSATDNGNTTTNVIAIIDNALEIRQTATTFKAIFNAGNTLTANRTIKAPDASGTMQLVLVGTTAARPTTVEIGTMYYDTTLGYPIWYQGLGVWVNSTGATV